MNKQELIDDIKKITYSDLEYNSPERMLSQQKLMILDKVRQLDEQPKVTVPKFAADWFEKNKDDLTFAIYEAVAHSIKEAGYKHYSDEFMGWFAHSDNNSIETLIRMKDGYKVEEVK